MRVGCRGCAHRASWLAPVGLLLLLTAMSGCAAASEATPLSSRTPVGTPAGSGSVDLSGALVASVPLGPQDARAGCSSSGSTLAGTVDFGSGASAVVLSFSGVPGTTTFPLPGFSTPGIKFVAVTLASGSGIWRASGNFPASSGTLTLAVDASGSIRGVVDAELSPVAGATKALHVTGHWTC